MTSAKKPLESIESSNGTCSHGHNSSSHSLGSHGSQHEHEKKLHKASITLKHSFSIKKN
jgi:hypothetical protein